MTQNGTDLSEHTAGLTDRQLAALPYLITSPSISEGASMASIGRTTLYRWMADGEFRQTLQRLREEAADLALAELRGLMLKGVLVLAEAMEDPNPHVRVRAARVALSMGFTDIELKELRQRIERLDDALALRARRHPLP